MRKMTDQEIVQQYADEGRLNELPAGVYVLTGPVCIPPKDHPDDTAAIRRAIDAATAAGQSRVALPTRRCWLCSALADDTDRFCQSCAAALPS